MEILSNIKHKRMLPPGRSHLNVKQWKSKCGKSKYQGSSKQLMGVGAVSVFVHMPELTHAWLSPAEPPASEYRRRNKKLKIHEETKLSFGELTLRFPSTMMVAKHLLGSCDLSFFSLIV